MSLAEFEADVVIDARDCIMGRVSTNVAERALDAVIPGSRDDVLGKYEKRSELGSDRGPAYPKRPDRIFKRAIRGMVPYKSKRGREAFSNVRVYVGNPYDEDGELVDGTSIDRLSNTRFVTLGEVADHLGANVTW